MSDIKHLGYKAPEATKPQLNQSGFGYSEVKVTEEKPNSVFNKIDTNGDGQLTEEELINHLHERGINLNDVNIDEAINQTLEKINHKNNPKTDLLISKQINNLVVKISHQKAKNNIDQLKKEEEDILQKQEQELEKENDKLAKILEARKNSIKPEFGVDNKDGHSGLSEDYIESLKKDIGPDLLKDAQKYNINVSEIIVRTIDSYKGDSTEDKSVKLAIKDILIQKIEAEIVNALKAKQESKKAKQESIKPTFGLDIDEDET